MTIKLTLLIFFGLASANFSMVRQNDEGTGNCTNPGCHNNLIEKSVIHSPIQDGCEYCHEKSGNVHPGAEGNEFTLVKAPPELCEVCHESKKSEKVVHEPVAEGECLQCHSPHSSPNQFLLKESSIVKLCEDCHDSDMWNNKTKHQPVSDGACLNCHNPHQSNFPQLLVSKLPELCFNCHNKEKNEYNMADVHPPFEDNCLDCHAVHGSENSNLLTAKLPDICFSCHEELQNSLKKKTVHQAIREGQLCLNCHNQHASGNDNLLKTEGQKLCFQCHGKVNPLEAEQSVNIQKKVSEKFVHEPIVSDGCSDCHTPHASDYTALLTNTFPEGNYTIGVVDSFALCFDCHDSDLLEKQQTDDATNFRNGKTNLHYLHVKREKGRNCIDCHDVHGAPNIHLIGNKVRFGHWEMPINYKTNETGGSCLPGCHGEKKYKR